MDFRLAPSPDSAPVNGIKDLVIAGGGPAALSAALYGARYGMDLLVLESWQPGGQAALTALIENYPGVPSVPGARLAATMREQAAEAGAGFTSDTALEASIEGDLILVKTGSGELRARTLIIATGATPSRLGVPGEDRYIGRGVSFCATCDAPFYRGRKVVVVGGGDSAVKEALHLARVVESLVLVHRRDTLRAEPALADELLSCPSCSVKWNSRVTAITGDDSGVTGVDLDTPEGREHVKTDGVFLYVGTTPATGPFRELVELDDRGAVVTRNIVETSAPGVFAAGDVTANGFRQVVTAASDGARAAWAAFEYLADRRK
jgi:thioredoxin reductase (NADPH)